MARKLTRIKIFFILAISAILLSFQCTAQVVPDTSLNKVFPPPSNDLRNETPAVNVDSTNRGNHPLLNQMKDTVVKKTPFQPNPKKAGLYSAILPGLGQLYNRQYWKVPVIYAGAAVAGYFIADNLKNYHAYRKAYIGRLNNPYPNDPYPNYTTANLQQLQSDYERFLDLSVLISGVGYALQVMDAIVAAHLKNFDISPDISMRMQPVTLPLPNGTGAGLGLVVNF